MLTASLVEFAIAKLRMWQTHNAQLANFDVASLRVRATAKTQQADVQVICLNCSELKPQAHRGGYQIWIVDAHRDDRKRFIVRADKKLSAFLELESAIRLWVTTLILAPA
jgi:hypothetical protein